MGYLESCTVRKRGAGIPAEKALNLSLENPLIVVGLFAVWVMREFFGKLGVLRGEVSAPAPSSKRAKSAVGG